MTPEEFLSDFVEDQMPDELGPVIHLYEHDPPFKKKELREMAKLGFIVLDKDNWTYRLTMKSSLLFKEKFLR